MVSKHIFNPCRWDEIFRRLSLSNLLKDSLKLQYNSFLYVLIRVYVQGEGSCSISGKFPTSSRKKNVFDNLGNML